MCVFYTNGGMTPISAIKNTKRAQKSKNNPIDKKVLKKSQSVSKQRLPPTTA